MGAWGAASQHHAVAGANLQLTAQVGISASHGASTRAGGNGTTAQFIALAEQVSGRDLDAALFNTWLYAPGKPTLRGTGAAGTGGVAAARKLPPVAAVALRQIDSAGNIRY